MSITRVSSNMLAYDGGAFSLRNKIINGDMRIDQRNAGVITMNLSSQYPVDRFVAYKATVSGTMTAQKSAVAPAGFSSSLLFTVTASATSGASDQNAFWQVIEGLNMSDLAWGTASAMPITLSFKVRASVPGLYSVNFTNNATDRWYVATFTVNAANVFEDKIVVVPGDTSGTWLTDNGKGLQVTFDLGYGSSFKGTPGSWGNGSVRSATGSVSLLSNAGATMYFTGIQVEAGSSETPFERRPFSIELGLCQRYYEIGTGNLEGYCTATTGVRYGVSYKVTKRITPASITQSFTSQSGITGTAYAASSDQNNFFLGAVKNAAAGTFSFQCTWIAEAEL